MKRRDNIPKGEALDRPTDKIDLTPDRVRPRSGHFVSWRRVQGHEWKANIQHRTQGNLVRLGGQRRIMFQGRYASP